MKKFQVSFYEDERKEKLRDNRKGITAIKTLQRSKFTVILGYLTLIASPNSKKNKSDDLCLLLTVHLPKAGWSGIVFSAGCTDEDILSHCRESGPHVRGCWAVDLVLGKE